MNCSLGQEQSREYSRQCLGTEGITASNSPQEYGEGEIKTESKGEEKREKKILSLFRHPFPIRWRQSVPPGMSCRGFGEAESHLSPPRLLSCPHSGLLSRAAGADSKIPRVPGQLLGGSRMRRSGWRFRGWRSGAPEVFPRGWGVFCPPLQEGGEGKGQTRRGMKGLRAPGHPKNRPQSARSLPNSDCVPPVTGTTPGAQPGTCGDTARWLRPVPATHRTHP